MRSVRAYPYVRRWPGRLVAALLLLPFIGSCSDDDPVGPDPVPPSIAVAVSPSTITLEQGSSETLNVTLSRSGDYAGTVTVSLSGLPAGVTAPSVSLTSGTTQAQIQLTASAAATEGSGTIAVRAEGSGVEEATATFTLQVTTPPATTPAIGLAISPATLTLNPGAAGTIVATITRSGGFAGSVALEIEDLPEGLTVAPADIAAGETSTTIEFVATDDAPTGTSTVTVRASGDGVDDATATFTLQVTEASEGDFALSLDSTSLTVQQGETASTTLEIDRSGGYAGAVTLTSSGAPSGLSVSFSENPVTGNSSTIEVAPNASLAAGNYQITINGTAEAGDIALDAGRGEDVSVAADPAITLTVTVTATPSGPSDVYSWPFCPDVPAWVAYQDGSGPWTGVDISGGAVEFEASSERIGVAYVMVNDGNPTLRINYAARHEMPELIAGLCPGTRSASGTVSGLGPVDMAFISLGNASSVVAGAVGNTFDIRGIRDGSIDLVAGRQGLTISGTSVSSTLNRIVLERDVTPADGMSIDFEGASSFAPASGTVTATNLGSDAAIQVMVYMTGGNTGVLYTGTSFESGASRSYQGVPAEHQQPDDLHLLTLNTDYSGGVFGKSRGASVMFRDVAARNLVFGPALGSVSISTASTAPYVRPRVQYTRQSEYNRYWFVNYQQDVGGTHRDVQVYVTDDYQGAGDIDITLPDFSGVSGWNNAWALATGGTLTWAFVTSGWDEEDGALGPASLAEGVQIRTATELGQVNP